MLVKYKCAMFTSNIIEDIDLDELDDIMKSMFTNSYKEWISNLNLKLCKIIYAASKNEYDGNLISDWNSYYTDITEAYKEVIERVNINN